MQLSLDYTLRRALSVMAIFCVLQILDNCQQILASNERDGTREANPVRSQNGHSDNP